MADKGSIYMAKSIGQELHSVEHLSAQVQKQNNDLIRRRLVHDQSDKMNFIEGQYQ